MYRLSWIAFVRKVFNMIKAGGTGVSVRFHKSQPEESYSSPATN